VKDDLTGTSKWKEAVTLPFWRSEVLCFHGGEYEDVNLLEYFVWATMKAVSSSETPVSCSRLHSAVSQKVVIFCPLSWHLLGGSEEKREPAVSRAEIPAVRLPNAKREC
jgi:hypothetical protein